MEEQPWIWNDMKLAGALRKFNSILDVGVIDEDNDNIDDRTATQQNLKVAAPVSNFREMQKQQQQQQKPTVRATSGDKRDEDYIYDVEGRPVLVQQANAGRQQFYVKTADMKRSQKVSAHRRPYQGGSMASSPSSSSSSFASTGDDISSSPQSMPVVINAKEAEPRVLPLLGFHTAVNKINRQKEALLKKILRQAGWFSFSVHIHPPFSYQIDTNQILILYLYFLYSSTSVDEKEPKLYAEMHSTGPTTSGPMSFAVLAARASEIEK